MKKNIIQFISDHRLLVFVSAAVIGMVVTFVVISILRQRRRRHGSITMPSSPVFSSQGKPLAATKPPVYVSGTSTLEPSATRESSRPHPVLSVPWPQPPVVGSGISPDWAEFISDRLRELDPASCVNETKWALGIVDFLDELEEASAEATNEERALSAKFRTALLAILVDNGFATLDSNQWNPGTQRAVAVVRKPDATETTILGKGSTGLSRNGKVIRKQEVKISTKGK